MTKEVKYTLVGAIRLPKSGDSIGLPIFTNPPSNMSFTVETDHFLRITKFRAISVDNPDIDYIIGTNYTVHYQRGDFTPMPVWIRGNLRIFGGGMGSYELDLEVDPNTRDFPVLGRLRRIFQRARYKEFASTGEPERFWESFRFLFQNLSGGLQWVTRFRSVMRQAHAYLRPDGVEYPMLTELIEAWIDSYITKTSHAVYKEIVDALSASPTEINPQLLLSVCAIEQLMFAENTSAIVDVLLPLGLYPVFNCVETIYSHAPMSSFAQRHLRSWEIKYNKALERCFDQAKFRHLVFLVENFGRIPLPNHLKYTVPSTINSKFITMRSLETKIIQADEVGDFSHMNSLLADYDEEVKEVKALAFLANGATGVTRAFKAYGTAYFMERIDNYLP